MLNWGLQNGTKVHKVKAKKNMTLMLITDPTKNGITFRIPKWVRFPMLALAIAIVLSVLYTVSYIADLESQLAAERSYVAENKYTIITKDFTIDDLEEVDAKRFDQLEALAMLTAQLKSQLNELEAYKQVIDEKLGSTEKTTDSQPTRRAVAGRSSEGTPRLGDNQPVINDLSAKLDTFLEEDGLLATGTEEEMDAFGDEVDRLIAELTDALDQLDVEQASYEVREEQVEEILPYWDAFPSVIPVSDTYVTSAFGYRRNPFGRGYEFHKGVDFKAYYQDVWATGSGVVTYSGYNNGYGYMVIIDHGFGIVTKYAHNSKLYVKEGDLVERYDVIARSGNSGRSSGPHLHYEIILDGENQDPMDFIYQGETE